MQGLGEFVPVRPLTDADFPAVQACYAKYAKTFNGMLDRGSYIWNRVRLWRDVPYQGFAIWNDANEIEGYIYLSQTRLPSGRQEIALSDHAFLTPRAGQGLLRFLSDFTMMAEEITLNAGPIAPLVSLMPQQRYTVERREYSMLRITNLQAAIAARGYLPHVRAEFNLDIHDHTVSSNAGLWRVTVRDGQGTAEPSARGTNAASCVRLDIRALAAIYSGFYSASQASLLGWVTGPSDSLRSVDAVFSGSTPWMTDMF